MARQPSAPSSGSSCRRSPSGPDASALEVRVNDTPQPVSPTTTRTERDNRTAPSGSARRRTKRRICMPTTRGCGRPSAGVCVLLQKNLARS
jgi:hypothetical protein